MKHIKFAYRLNNVIYDFLWLSINPIGEIYAVLPSKKEMKNEIFEFLLDGKIIETRRMIDHITFHNTGRVHWKSKGNNYLNKRDLPTPIFNLPEINTIGLFAITVVTKNIDKIFPQSKGAKFIFGQINTEFTTITCHLASRKNYIAFYEEYLKKYNASNLGPIFIDTDINEKVLIIMKTEYTPKDVYNGYLTKQTSLIENGDKAEYLSAVGVLLPTDYFENYLLPSK